MITVIKKVKVYAPEYLGVRDVLLVGDKIGSIEDNIDFNCECGIDVTVIDGKNKLLVPGFIDSHVHILGGGGEGGYKTRIPEIMLSDITRAGVTTVVGCLGTDGTSRSLISLLAKARGLEEEGITTFIYSGSYRIPVITITDDIIMDLVTIDKVIGVGEIALSDHRSSQPTLEEVERIVAEARVGGFLSGKAGIVNVHLGSSKKMLNMLFDIVDQTELPITQFLPTHTNGNPGKLGEAIRYAKAGGYIDFTTSSYSAAGGLDDDEIKSSAALKMSLEQGVPEDRITFSSDAQGSLPLFDSKKQFIGLGIGKVESLFREVRDSVIIEKIPLEKAIKVITSNPAEILKLKKKGRVESHYDADLCLLEEASLEIDTVIAKGKLMLQHKQVKVYGTFENQCG